MSNTGRVTAAMQVPNLLGMDPLTFTLTVLTLVGLLFSAFNFLRHFTPKNLYIRTADAITQTRALYDLLESERLLPGGEWHHLQLRTCLELLEDRVKPLMFVILPTKNIIKILRAWLKVWVLLEISQEIEVFRVGIQTLSEQRKRMDRVREAARHGGVSSNITNMEADAEATTEMFISTLGVRETHCSRDVERNLCTNRLSSLIPEELPQGTESPCPMDPAADGNNSFVLLSRISHSSGPSPLLSAPTLTSDPSERIIPGLSLERVLTTQLNPPVPNEDNATSDTRP